MIDATGRPKKLLLLGGTSDIAVAIARAYVAQGSTEIVSAARPGPRREATAAELSAMGATVRVVDFDAREADSHREVVDLAWQGGDVDIAVVAFGVLEDNEVAWQDGAVAHEMASVNYTAAVTVGVELGARIRQQGHGVIVALSSVAGERARRSNFVYGSTKAGFDAFYTGLGETLREHGGRVLVVRPGFVASKMTTGLEPAPLSTTPEVVAEAVQAAIRAGREQIWVPASMRYVMSVLRHLPRPVFRRLPL
ncbi:decaprenylphospho-beta-D-erythro-pentofuranosid-2 -ulose 2-reductase [Alloalcanivorax gelatiniphagus]